MKDRTGETLSGRYTLIRRLGGGGMGAVYLGQHRVIGKRVAVKILHVEFAGSQEMVTRFYREAQAAAAIGHRNIIDVLDVGVTDENEPYIAMEFLEGESFGALLSRRGPIDESALCAVVEPVLLALSAAHSKGIVHRDLKPDNIFVAYGPEQEPLVKLIDFGISKVVQSQAMTKLTRTGTMLGTPAYMSPEQARGDLDVDHRVDLYAVGVIMFEALTGRLPFVGANYNQLIASVLTELPRWPADVRTTPSQRARDTAMRALSKDPAERFADAKEMLEHVRSFEGYSTRAGSLASLTSGSMETTIASGDLGDTLLPDSGDRVPEDVLARMAGDATPSEWAASKRLTSKRNRRRLVLGIGAFACAVVVAVLVTTSLGKDKGAARPTAAPPVDTGAPPGNDAVQKEQPPTAARVMITIEGSPPGARVYYENALVAENPFGVEPGESAAQLRVEADGFAPFVTSLVPRSDQVVPVELKAVIPQPSSPQRSDAKPADGSSKKRRSGDAKESSESFRKGAKGTEFTGSFQ